MQVMPDNDRYAEDNSILAVQNCLDEVNSCLSTPLILGSFEAMLYDFPIIITIIGKILTKADRCFEILLPLQCTHLTIN